jgi:hypothetical protein
MMSQGSGAWMTSQGSGETDRGRMKRRSAGRLGHLSFSFGSERSRALGRLWWTVGCYSALVDSFCSENGVPRFAGTRHGPKPIFTGVSNFRYCETPVKITSFTGAF